MTDFETIALWIGWSTKEITYGPLGLHTQKIWINQNGSWCDSPCFNTDEEAIGLLKILAERGYIVSLEGLESGWVCYYANRNEFAPEYVDTGIFPSIHEAIVSVTLSVIENE